jgi:high-affinity iron transporter
MNEFIITLRETLEASLIIGIVITFLNKKGFNHLKRYVWQGLGAAIIASILVAIFFVVIQSNIHHEAYEKLFEAIMMYMAAGFLSYMVIWMAKNTQIKQELENNLQQDTSQKAIFALVFFAVIREGFETVLFLFASFQTTKTFSYLGFIAGIALAVFIGYQIFVLGKKVNIKSFFNFTSILLIYMAAGMVAYGTHEMEEFMVKMNWLNEESISRPFDILKPVKEIPENTWIYTQKGEKFYHWFHDKGAIGEFLKGFFGYNSNPNWIELFLWLFSLITVYYIWKKSISISKKSTQV